MMMLLSLTGCTANKLQLFSQTTFSFDTVITIKGYCASQDDFNNYYSQAVAAFNTYYQLFDRYNDYPEVNNLKTINDHPGQAIKVEKDLIYVLLLTKQYYDYSSGKLNCTMGHVIDRWTDFRENYSLDENTPLPTLTDLQADFDPSGFSDVLINETDLTVKRASDSKVLLDVGAVAKGYATQKVAELLRQLGMTSGFISAGGNVVLLGPKPDGSDWKVGLANPDNPASSLLYFNTAESYSIVTSGNYQRSVIKDGVNYHHLIDPDTLMPADLYTAVTIIGPDSTYCDLLSTTLFLLSIEQGQKLLNQYHPDYVAVWMQTEQQKPDKSVGFAAQDFWITTSTALTNLTVAN